MIWTRHDIFWLRFLMCWFKAALAVNFVFNVSIWKINNINVFSGAFFVWNTMNIFNIHDKYWISFTHVLASKDIFIPRYIPKEMFLNKKYLLQNNILVYLITNQNLFSTFKRNIFQSRLFYFSDYFEYASKSPKTYTVMQWTTIHERVSKQHVHVY